MSVTVFIIENSDLQLVKLQPNIIYFQEVFRIFWDFSASRVWVRILKEQSIDQNHSSKSLVFNFEKKWRKKIGQIQ